jgi:hypothetical protein
MSEPTIAFAEHLTRLAESCGAIVIDGLPVHADNLAIVVLEAPEFFRALTAAPPRLVYFQRFIFDFEGEIDSAVESLREVMDDADLRARLRHVARVGTARDGAICESSAAFFADGLLHFSGAVADWYEQFQETIAVHVDEVRAELRAERDRRSSHLDNENRAKAEALARNNAFNFGRVSFEKRLLLAKQLWPDQEESELRIITDEAQKIDWLIQSGAMDKR